MESLETPLIASSAQGGSIAAADTEAPVFESATPDSITRRRVLKSLLYGAAGVTLYAGEIERHWIEVVHRDIFIGGLPAAFDGMTIAQLSDIHLNEYTEAFLLREAVDEINRMQPDMVLLTGDYVSAERLSKELTMKAAWQCASLLGGLRCPQRFAILGNHDVMAGANQVSEAITSHGIPVLRNGFIPIERSGSRIWLAGLDDPVLGRPNPDVAIPVSIRSERREPVILMCHAPDFVDVIAGHPVSRSIALVLSGHTHGGQVRIPLLGAMQLPPWGRKYVEGWFGVGGMQLYVNRGIGAVGLPFRFNCRPEITLLRLRRPAEKHPPYLRS